MFGSDNLWRDDDELVIMATMFEFLIFFFDKEGEFLWYFKGVTYGLTLWTIFFSAEQIIKFRGHSKSDQKREMYSLSPL